MNFLEIAQARQSCRAYDETREVEQEKLDAILEAARIAPSACNGQPYLSCKVPGWMKHFIWNQDCREKYQ